LRKEETCRLNLQGGRGEVNISTLFGVSRAGRWVRLVWAQMIRAQISLVKNIITKFVSVLNGLRTVNKVRRLILLETIERGAVFLTSIDAIMEKKDK
jgi:hypothetical protein